MINRTLFIVDLQRDFCKNGTLEIPTADYIVPKINQLLPKYTSIIASKDWHPAESVHFQKWPIHAVENTEGAEFHPELNTDSIQQIFLKGTDNKDDGYSAFESTNLSLEDYLREKNITKIDFCGLATDFCIRATAKDALKLGFDVRIIVDAVDAVNILPKDGDEALAELEKLGATLITSSEL